MVKTVVAQLREHGQVERGWLGVQIQNVTPDLAEALGLDEAAGAMVAAVTPDSPAEEAGIKTGDVILGFAGKDIADSRELAPRSEARRVGQECVSTGEPRVRLEHNNKKEQNREEG